MTIMVSRRLAAAAAFPGSRPVFSIRPIRPRFPRFRPIHSSAPRYVRPRSNGGDKDKSVLKPVIGSRAFHKGFVSEYDPDAPPRGPIFGKPAMGKPDFYPKELKRVLDDYVVGQDRAKKTISTVVFNHSQKLRYRIYVQEQARLEFEKQMRRHLAEERAQADKMREAAADDKKPLLTQFLDRSSEMASKELARLYERSAGDSQTKPATEVFRSKLDATTKPPVNLDKSNLLLMGPTGVGKTYIVETLSKAVKVPFAIADCNQFTQAGYIGLDAESCIEKLLIEANYDVAAAERGIVVLDEFDKLAKRSTYSGRDVSGEGVQQALLKLVEGTKVTINVRGDGRGGVLPPRSSGGAAGAQHPPSPPTGPGGGGGGGSGGMSATPPPPPPPPPPPTLLGGRPMEQFVVDTSNILFVFCGAFVGLEDQVLRRVARRSIGFTANIRGGSEVADDAYAHLPHQPSLADEASSSTSSSGTPTSPSSSSPSSSTTSPLPSSPSHYFTPLDLATPADLHNYGFIPEIIGRVHNLVALQPLRTADLQRILTEPRNSLVRQYTELFASYPSTVAFTRAAVRAIAERASAAGTGARALRMEVERVLAEPMYDAPVPYVLVTEASVRGGGGGGEKVLYYGKEGRMEWERRRADEDAAEEERLQAGRRRADEDVAVPGAEEFTRTPQAGAQAG